MMQKFLSLSLPLIQHLDGDPGAGHNQRNNPLSYFENLNSWNKPFDYEKAIFTKLKYLPLGLQNSRNLNPNITKLDQKVA